jgi:hypothetical protein
MTAIVSEAQGFKQILEEKQAQFLQVLRRRDPIAIAAINPRRLAAVPWALPFKECLKTADRHLRRTTGSAGEAPMDAA